MIGNLQATVEFENENESKTKHIFLLIKID